MIASVATQVCSIKSSLRVMSMTLANHHSTTMSKFIIVCCVVLVATTVYGTALENQPKSNEEVKQDCIRSIAQAFADAIQLVKDFYSASENQEYYRARLDVLLHDGTEAMNRIIKKVNETETPIVVRSASIFPEHVVLCDGNIVDELAQIVKELLHLVPRNGATATVR